jgi:hypothetical protein
VDVEFSPDAAFFSDGVAARVTARMDFAVADPDAVFYLTTTA